ncbi:MAG: hypothetical protein QOE29_789, partial [Gaiellaceae bacterium]|nr:hypothetical protein [Gaiellaceae bacterium]
QVAKSTDAAAQKIEQRADDAIGAIERQRDAALDTLERRAREDARETSA